jgi:hypothetical protein
MDAIKIYGIAAGGILLLVLSHLYQARKISIPEQLPLIPGLFFVIGVEGSVCLRSHLIVLS